MSKSTMVIAEPKAATKIIAIDEKYSDNNGAYDVVIMWNGSEIITDVIDSRGIARESKGVTEYATKAEVAEAVKWHIANIKTKGFIGDTYIVGGSRKVAKGTKVVVIDYADEGRFGIKVQVQDEDGVKNWISVGCLKEWVCGSAPFWANRGIDEPKHTASKKSVKTVSSKTVEAIKQFLAQCEKYRNSYFWSGFGNQQQRTWKENQEKFTYSGDGIELDFSISLSRNNCYVSKSVVIDGKQTTARSLAKFLK